MQLVGANSPTTAADPSTARSGLPTGWFPGGGNKMFEQLKLLNLDYPRTLLDNTPFSTPWKWWESLSAVSAREPLLSLEPSRRKKTLLADHQSY